MTPPSKLLHRSGRELVYSAGTFSDALASLRELQVEARPGSTIVFRPRVPRQPDIEAAAAAVSTRQFCQIGYMREARVRGPSMRKTGGATGRRPSSRAELRYALTDSFIRDFATPWRKYLGRELIGSFLDILISRCTVGGTTLIEDEDRLLGMVSIFPEHDCLGRPLDQVGWVWIDRSLKQSQRAAAHAVVSHALTMSESPRLQAGVHIKNLRSQRFFSRLGFRPTCIHCPPRRP